MASGNFLDSAFYRPLQGQLRHSEPMQPCAPPNQEVKNALPERPLYGSALGDKQVSILTSKKDQVFNLTAVLRLGDNPNALNQQGRSPLDLLSGIFDFEGYGCFDNRPQAERLAKATLLLQAGANPNPSNPGERGALYWAAASEYSFCLIPTMLQHGASPLCEYEGATPLERAFGTVSTRGSSLLRREGLFPLNLSHLLLDTLKQSRQLETDASDLQRGRLLRVLKQTCPATFTEEDTLESIEAKAHQLFKRSLRDANSEEISYRLAQLRSPGMSLSKRQFTVQRRQAEQRRVAASI